MGDDPYDVEADMIEFDAMEYDVPPDVPNPFIAFGESVSRRASPGGAPQFSILIVIAIASLALEIFRYCKEKHVQRAIEHAYHHPGSLVVRRLAHKLDRALPKDGPHPSAVAHAMILEGYEALHTPARWEQLKASARAPSSPATVRDRNSP